MIIVLYEYTNKENDIVRNAFRTGNWDSLRDLPNDLKPFNVQQQISRRLQLEELHSSMVSQNKRIAREILKENGGLFQRFEWMKDPYYLSQANLSKERQDANDKMITDRPFNPAQVKRALRHEYPFLGLNEVSTYTFLSQNDPYEASRDEKLRALWIEECKNLYGPFKPSGSQKPLSIVAKSQLREIVDVLKRLLLSDWNDVNFVIGSKFNLRVNSVF